MKKNKKAIKKRRATKKGKVKTKRTKVAKKHVSERNNLKAAAIRKAEKEFEEHYNSLMGQ